MVSKNEVLGALWLKHRFSWDGCFQAIRSREQIDPSETEALAKAGAEYITILDDDYPEKLRNAPKAPFVLFYEGDLSLLKTESKVLAIIGPVSASEATKRATERIVSDLAMEIVLAVPIVGRAAQETIETAVSSGAKVIGIAPNDIRLAEPSYRETASKILSSGGLIVSEYAGGKAPPDSRVMATRILAGLSDAMLCTDSAKRGLEGLAIAMALNCGKDVGCLPHEATASMNNVYIKEGAALIEGAEDVRLLFNSKRKEP